jgi:dihydroneopterin aldolase
MGRTDRIELRALRVTGVHGVLPEERDRAQPFEVDLDLEVDLSAAGRSDDLADTVDYGAVAAAVHDAVARGPHADLLEHLAQRVADAAFSAAGPVATGVSVTIRKTRPPVPMDLATAGVTIYRQPPAGRQPPTPAPPEAGS